MITKDAILNIGWRALTGHTLEELKAFEDKQWAARRGVNEATLLCLRYGIDIDEGENVQVPIRYLDHPAFQQFLWAVGCSDAVHNDPPQQDWLSNLHYYAGYQRGKHEMEGRQ
ncbi:hypothetical protein H6F93_00555 [Leptolyngbya sp. FACHB-671]|uniref:hypothetical protein n=1 Tax=Leptolyngbya sp. FACHB-671 TaxID=2692812 RepID=UPI0016878DAC|nr:hypothetical protein [Leptolyngbya sp. FACHB-671]MBD2066041.1 hypothetical protein [Leptolyngbya sp. FACHB-671]